MLESYLGAFKKSAFRLELLQEYRVPEERDPMDYFLEGEGIPTDFGEEWLSVVLAAKKRGAKMQRVHVVDQPLSDYLRFEMEFYKRSKKAGEEIYILEREKFEKIGTDVTTDFWLFDDEVAVKMMYNDQGEYVDYDSVAVGVEEFVDLKERLLKKAKRL